MYTLNIYIYAGFKNRGCIQGVHARWRGSGPTRAPSPPGGAMAPSSPGARLEPLAEADVFSKTARWDASVMWELLNYGDGLHGGLTISFGG